MSFDNIQKEIIEWCQEQPLDHLKHILTIRNPLSLEQLKKILDHDPQSKPIDRLSHGYSETKVNNEKNIYVRFTYRYKSKKEEKTVMDKVLLENITISRLKPYSFSLKKQFIGSQQFKKCMMLFSDAKIFHIFTPIGSAVPQSPWFDPAIVKSFSEWIIHFFQMEIFNAFKLHKTQRLSLNPYLFIEENIKRDLIRKYLDSILAQFTQKRLNGKFAKKTTKKGLALQTIYSSEEDEEEEEDNFQVDIRPEEVQYILNRCLDKFQSQDRSFSEIVLEYQWYSQERNSKVNKILKELCKIIASKYRDYRIELKGKEIEVMNEKKKKKRKKNKKTKEGAHQNVDEFQGDIPTSQEKAERVDGKVIQLAQPQKKRQKLKIVEIDDETKLRQQQLKPSDNISTPKKQLSLISKKSKKGKAMKEDKKQPYFQVEASDSILKQKAANEKEQLKKENRVIWQRIDQYIIFFHSQLAMSSQAIDKYRKICLQTIEQSLKGLQIKGKWQLVIYGSNTIDFSLRDSDLDIAIVAENPEQCSLDMLAQHFKVQEWLRDCTIHQLQSARVRILEFQILLSHLKHPKIKQSKKLNEVIHVDISLTSSKEVHEGIKNTQIMQNIFAKHPRLKVVSLILKELLRVYSLNKPFKGGIGSYVLVIMVHNIINMQRIDINASYMTLLLEVCNFMVEKFQPFVTVISVEPKSETPPNPKFQLNLEHPLDGALLNTVKIRQIDEIIQLFDQLRTLLYRIKEDLRDVVVQQKKKMKRKFFQSWNILFQPSGDTEDL